MSRKLNSGKGDTPKDGIQWLSHAVFGVVCALVIGIFAWLAEPKSLELKGSGAEDSYYNLLVRGFRAGQLNLITEAPPGLVQRTDPYDPAVNTAYIGDLNDMSYYKGKLYLYFGVTPVLVLYWPYAATTGHYLPDKYAAVIFYTLGFLVATGLLRAVWRRYFSEVSILVAAAGVFIFGLAIGTQKVLSLWGSVYEVAVSCGFAFTMLALAAIWCALHEPKRKVLWLLMASLAYGLAIGSRPSLLFGGIILLMPVAQAWRAATEPGSRRRVGLLLAAAAGPVILIGLGLMLYNTLRFDSPFEFGWHYQLNGGYRPTTAQQFSLHYLWFNFRFYFLEPMRWGGHFPFLQGVPLLPLPSGHLGVGDPYGGILSNYPLVWLVLAAPLAWRGRPVEGVSVLHWFVAAVFLFFVICALTICLFFAAGSRYEMDFLPALMLLVVIGILGLEGALVGSPVWRRIARWSWCLLLVYVVVFDTLECVEAQAEANYLAGNFILSQGRVDEAIIQYQKALALWPESAHAHGGLGNALFQKGKMNETIIQYQKAVEIKPDFAEAHNNLGYCFLQIGRVDEAIVQYRRTIELQPRFVQAYNNLGNAFRRKRMAAEAMACYQKAIELHPQFIPAQINLASMLATWPEPSVRNGGKAVALAEQASQFSRGGDPLVLRTLAAAYAETGRFPEAVATAKRALAAAVTQSNTALTNALQTEIGLYQTNSPCRFINE
jgi:tetratricopeptide (TPR) repeat protein